MSQIDLEMAGEGIPLDSLFEFRYWKAMVYKEEDDDDFLQTILESFVEETKDTLETVASRILTLEEDPTNQVVLEEIFRIFHNIKANAKACGFTKLSDFAHRIESLLEQVRANKIILNKSIIDVLLKATDALEDSLEKSLKNESCDEIMKPVIEKINRLN